MTNLVTSLLPRSHTATRLGLVALGVGLLALSARVQVPFWPVPMTLQTMAVLLIGAAYGFRLGTATVASYLALGALGLPLFAHGGGLIHLVGPTGGYLAGFLAAAAAMGALADRGFGRTPVSGLALFGLGEVIIFALGAGWLSHLIGPAKAWAAGVVPFMPGEVLKMALAATLTVLAWKRGLMLTFPGQARCSADVRDSHGVESRNGP